MLRLNRRDFDARGRAHRAGFVKAVPQFGRNFAQRDQGGHHIGGAIEFDVVELGNSRRIANVVHVCMADQQHIDFAQSAEVGFIRGRCFGAAAQPWVHHNNFAAR